MNEEAIELLKKKFEEKAVATCNCQMFDAAISAVKEWLKETGIDKLNARIEQCTHPLHGRKCCIAIVIGDSEFHTDNAEDRKMILEEMEWME